MADETLQFDVVFAGIDEAARQGGEVLRRELLAASTKAEAEEAEKGLIVKAADAIRDTVGH